jgi:hypothetical protein
MLPRMECTRMNHEEELIKAFFVPTKRERYLEMIAKPKDREKFLRELGNFKALDPRYATPVRVNPAGLAALLKEKRVPHVCWVVSENPAIDGKSMSVDDALVELGRDMGTFLSFVPGKLAYFEDEDGHWILERH